MYEVWSEHISTGEKKCLGEYEYWSVSHDSLNRFSQLDPGLCAVESCERLRYKPSDLNLRFYIEEVKEKDKRE